MNRHSLTQGISKQVFQNTKTKHPAISVACKATRRPGFFIWNIFFVMVRYKIYKSIDIRLLIFWYFYLTNGFHI